MTNHPSTFDECRKAYEELRKDSERYRWLKYGPSSDFLSFYACGFPYDELDAAIDAAMEQSK